jgi:hypothetical protein
MVGGGHHNTYLLSDSTFILTVIADIADIREHMPGFLEVKCPL